MKCNSKNVVYLITCDRCQIRYVGETVQKLSARIKHFCRSVRQRTAFGCRKLIEHLNNGSCSSFTVNILDSCSSHSDKAVEKKNRLTRENFFYWFAANRVSERTESETVELGQTAARQGNWARSSSVTATRSQGHSAWPSMWPRITDVPGPSAPTPDPVEHRPRTRTITPCWTNSAEPPPRRGCALRRLPWMMTGHWGPYSMR